MKKRFFQSFFLQIIYKGFVRWFLKIVVGTNFGDSQFLCEEKQFIILANHNSHLDTLSLMSSIPGKLLWKIKPVAAEDYFGGSKLKAAFSNYFINTLLIRRKGNRGEEHNPIRKMLNALDAGYSLIIFPEGTRGIPEQMNEIKPGIARILSQRPHLKYVPVYMTGMGRSLPKGRLFILPYKSSVNYGKLSLALSTDNQEIIKQITTDFEVLQEKFQVIVK